MIQAGSLELAKTKKAFIEKYTAMFAEVDYEDLEKAFKEIGIEIEGKTLFQVLRELSNKWDEMSS